MTRETTDLDEVLKDFGSGQYRVGFAGPKMALSNKFYTHVLDNPEFQCSIAAVIVDKAHNISEWVIADIQDKLGFGNDFKCILVSNEKLNVALSVCNLQHPRDTFSGLLFLFPCNDTSPEDFPQTLIYVNSCAEAEQIQDFLQKDCPEWIPHVVFEFYHQYIAEDHKAIIKKAIADGTLRAVSATDTLGMGMDFRGIKRVILWMEPCTFNLIIQRLGRCVCIFSELGEAIVFITKAALKHFLVKFDLESIENPEDAPNEEDPEWEDGEEGQVDVVEDVLLEDKDEDEDEDGDILMQASPEPEPTQCQGTKCRKVLTCIEAHGRWFLLWFLTTEKCPHIPWNKSMETIRSCPLHLVHLQAPGFSRKSLPEVFDAVQQELRVLREKFVTDLYGHSQFLITGKMILQDNIIAILAEHARSVVSVDTLKQQVYWHSDNQFRNNIFQVVTLVVVRFPDTVQMAKQLEDRECVLKALLQIKQRDLHEKLSLIHEACLGPVLAVQDGARQVCRAFLRLPQKNVYPD
ncbi:hypothetical protein BT96DRAFT_991622 [Gymnopus androsaceus JB14]|uniref:Helicase C-terminal domain-containing protein n=1 Tax=Gymnopus androsaceus JB14 TaxID=1447944 RepID=A0A6A4HUT3_9AGAR|nr:hypothetical protein BT96DRAFT_991622 [Gymnopus androsaceus JB14]